MATNIKNIFPKFIFAVFIVIVVIAVASLKSDFFKQKMKNSQTISNEPTVSQSSPTTTATPQITQVLAAENSVNKRKIRIGIVVDDYQNKFNTIPDLEKSINGKFSTVSIYKQFGLPGNSHLTPSDLSYIRSSGKTLMIAWEPWNPTQGVNQSEDYLTGIANGKFDQYISDFANEIKEFQNPVILRFGHEMNGNWYPWGNRPEDYKKAYIKIVQIFKDKGVTNVKYCWSINSENVPPTPISNITAYYPGNAYVDMIGIDGYNWGSAGTNSSWKSFDSIFSQSYNFMISHYDKPVIITEIASSEEGGSKPQWINDMFTKLYTKYTSINQIVWFNLLKESDWRINSTPSSLNAFRNNLTN